MEMQILNEKDAPLLDRKEVKLKVNFFNTTTPSNSALESEVARKLKADPSLVVIKSIKQKFGAGEAEVTAYIYKSLDRLKFVEGKKYKPKVAAEKKEEAAKGE
ncbi:MAG: hypothetical protein V1906_02225 [Candidatus Woesearchaeota archaeon]